MVTVSWRENDAGLVDPTSHGQLDNTHPKKSGNLVSNVADMVMSKAVAEGNYIINSATETDGIQSSKRIVTCKEMPTSRCRFLLLKRNLWRYIF